MSTLGYANVISKIVLDCAFKVHNKLGPGLLESVYESALEYELKQMSLNVERQKSIPVIYDGHNLGEGFRIDLLVDDEVVVELKSVKELEPIHQAQLITYLRLMDKPVGLLINFNTVLLKDGIKKCYKSKNAFR
ncbi:MAG: GxxExxY protein [Bacteroidales bacterium]